MNKNRKKQWIISGCFFLVALGVVLILAKGLDLDQSKLPATIVGKPAYDFKVDWIQGQEFVPTATSLSFRLEDFKGKPLVLNFWASWCVSCRQEAKELEKFWVKYREDEVMVVGIAIQDTVEAAAQFAGAFGKTYILGLDTDGAAGIDYGVTGVPETFMINRQGQVVHKEVGPVDVAILERYLPEIL